MTITKIFWNLLFKKEFRRGFFLNLRAIHRSLDDDKRKGAIDDYKSILNIECMREQRPKILGSLGVCYYWENEYVLAEETLRQALKLSAKRKSKSAQLYAYLGHVCQDKGDLEEALMFYNMAFETGKKGLSNKILSRMAKVQEHKEFLEKYKDQLPFASAYIKQRKQKDDDFWK
ncbi:MAG: tetratricopeptide repeat protein [Phycisphaerae bacterium]|nr:tetratricopeptide repeat protein [Phycisphaerae bacterium]